MKTGTHFAGSYRRRQRRTWGAVAGLAIAVCAVTHSARGQDIFGFSNYKNNWTSATWLLDWVGTGTLCFDGHAGPYWYPEDVATTPPRLIRNNSYVMMRSVVGQPFDGLRFFRADYDIGEEIAPPPNVDYARLPQVHTDTEKLAFRVADGATTKIFTADYGLVSVDWWTDLATTVTQMYVITPRPAQTPVRLYHTEDGAYGPRVDLTNLANGPSTVTIHHNSNSIRSADTLWIDGERKMHAKTDTGLVVLEYRDASDRFVDVQVVEVRKYEPDESTANVEVGQLLAPEVDHPTSGVGPHVAQGLEGPKPFVFQYDRSTAEAALSRQVFPVRPTTEPDDVDLFWMHADAFGTEWPYEMHRYTSKWPDAAHADWLRVYWTEDQADGPTIDLTAALDDGVSTVTVYYNTRITASSTFWHDAQAALHASIDTGKVLLRYDEAPGTADTLEFIEVVEYVPDAETPDASVGTLLSFRDDHTSRVHAPYVARGLSGRPYAFQYANVVGEGALAGQVFPVRPTFGPGHDQLDLFWMRTARHGVEWPYEMHRYAVGWPERYYERIYWTEGVNKGPLVNLNDVAGDITVYYNGDIGSPSSLDYDTARKLHATADTGRVLLRYDEPAGTPDTLEFVDVRGVKVDYWPPIHVGQVFAPVTTITAQLGDPPDPYIGKGLDPPTTHPYVYQYGTAKTDMGSAFAVRPTTHTGQDDDIEAYWLHYGEHYGIVWPYEMDRYEADWDPATDWQRIYYTGDGEYGPPVPCANVDAVHFFYNNKVTSPGTLYLNNNPKEIRAKDVHEIDPSEMSQRGYILLGLETMGPSPFTLEFVEVFPYFRDYVTTAAVGAELLPIRDVADKLWPDTFVRTGTNHNPNDPANFVYQHAVSGANQEGRVFAVKPTLGETDIQIFFKREGEMRLKWPYEYHRYVTDWPDRWPTAGTQRLVRGTDVRVPGPPVPIPEELNARIMPYQEQVRLTGERKLVEHATVVQHKFYSDIVGLTMCDYYSLVWMQLGTPATLGQEWVGFQVVKSVHHTFTTDKLGGYFDPNDHVWDIGDEIIEAAHEGPLPGYIYHVPDQHHRDRYDPAIYEGEAGVRTGQIFPVFHGRLEVWWSNETRHGTDETSHPIYWPSWKTIYRNNWPPPPDGTIVIASEQGTSPTGYRYDQEPEVYYQNDATQVGFNPNYEHAKMFSYKDGAEDLAAFALRCDLNADSQNSTTDTIYKKPTPYVLVKYRDTTGEKLWHYDVYDVVPTNTAYPRFQHDDKAGTPVDRPYPLAAMRECAETSPGVTRDGSYGVSGPFWLDRKGSFWCRAGLDNGDPSQIVMRFWYPMQRGFIFPKRSDNVKYPWAAPTPWLNKLPGNVYLPGRTIPEPVNVYYVVNWPSWEDTPKMQTGETLVKQKFGLPNIIDQLSVEVLYESLNHEATTEGPHNVYLIDPIREREIDLSEIPPPEGPLETLPPGNPAFEVMDVMGKKYFPQLPPHLQNRVSYDPVNNKLELIGEYYEMLGEDILFVNVLSPRDWTFLRRLGTRETDKEDNKDEAWLAAVDALYALTNQPIILAPKEGNSAGKALVAATALNTNPTTAPYVTIAFNNHRDCPPASAISLEIIRVVEDLYRGEIAVIYPECCFDEKVTLRHKGDFAGKPDRYVFEWEWQVDIDGTTKTLIERMWEPYPDPDFVPTRDQVIGRGAVELTLRGGAGDALFTLCDNWFRCRYIRWDEGTQTTVGEYSAWTRPQLVEGWIKRVLGAIDPFEQRSTGGGIQGAEKRFSVYLTREVNTVVDMIAQAGPPWAGNVPLNCSKGLEELGLIEIYETVLGRGKMLSIDAGYRYSAANRALLLAAGRIADLYMLLGNEAYADAADPTIAFGTDDGTYGKFASSIHCFMNQTGSLLEEELGLLRGRDDSKAPGVQVAPLYNRLMWNFTRDITGGEVAYALNYNIQDEFGNVDGAITELDAMKLYPMGHGDAWGHYLSAIKRYYSLLRHPSFDWENRLEAVLVGGQAVTIGYTNERKFAKAAAAKAKTGAELVNLTYRQAYVEDPEGQWQGYKDNNPARQWGLSEWASRAGQGAYFDWLVANTILPDEDPDETHTGIQKVDRTTVAELREIVAAFDQVQMRVDEADVGLNPLGLSKNVLPFDVDPARVAEGDTHFEQIYDRAMIALNNAVRAFDFATNCTQLLRRQADKQVEFQHVAEDQEADFKSRLIEIFGYPYEGDIGEGKTYPQGYDGPDLVHYDYVDASPLLGRERIQTKMFTLHTFEEFETDGDGNFIRKPLDIQYHVSLEGFGVCLPEGEDWGQRRAPGELQLIRSRLIQQFGQFKQLRAEYEDLIQGVEDQADQIDERVSLMTTMVNIKERTEKIVSNIRDGIKTAKEIATKSKNLVESFKKGVDAITESIPKNFVAGFSCGGDLTAIARGAAKTASIAVQTGKSIAAEIAEIVQTGRELAMKAMETKAEIEVFATQEEYEVNQMVRVLQADVRKEVAKRLELDTMAETMIQTIGEYQATLARGLRILDERTRFRIRTASKTQDFRYKDMGFRIFRNDALQKYRAQFDLASRYVYLAGKAYDYETNLLSRDKNAGQFFLTSIVRARSLGNIVDGEPLTGGGIGDPGLADIMARMKMNWDLVLEGQLGFNNPQTETNRFSLRRELFRCVDDNVWRETLRQNRVDNLLAVREFDRYCRVFHPHEDIEPGLVITLPTTVNFGFNFFGEPLAAGDSAYDSTNFATKVRSVGVWFSDYDALTSAGLSNTPRVYLIPVGYDIMRSPTDDTGRIRTWKILDQKLPVPFPIGHDALADPEWIPMVDTLSEEYAAIRRYSSFRAYHDSGEFDPAETISDSRLIGRSVWNTRWLLIIPAGTLHANREYGLDTFINGVSDIKLFFQTYAYSGN